MFGADVNSKILSMAHTTEEEICGVIVDGSPVFLKNAAPNPVEEFLIMEIPEGAQAVFHSHPGGPFYPSKLDMKQQFATMLPWGIACTHWRHNQVIWFGDGIQEHPLIGRGFIHGVTDCYELIRDFYREIHSIDLPYVPREWEWWDDGESLYESNLDRAGFSAVGLDEIQPGDSILITIRANTPNHAAVYLGNGLMLHHLGGKYGFDPARLSTVESVARWQPYIRKVVRHKDVVDRTVGQHLQI